MKNPKIVFVCVCLAAAAVIFWFNLDSAPAIPDTPDTETMWMCRDCGKTFALTAAKFAVEEERAGGSAPLHCIDCSKKEAYRVAQCTTCDTFYFSRDVPGALGRCPQCYPARPGGGPADGGSSEQEEPPPPAV